MLKKLSKTVLCLHFQSRVLFPPVSHKRRSNRKKETFSVLLLQTAANCFSNDEQLGYCSTPRSSLKAECCVPHRISFQKAFLLHPCWSSIHLRRSPGSPCDHGLLFYCIDICIDPTVFPLSLTLVRLSPAIHLPLTQPTALQLAATIQLNLCFD